MPNSKNSNSRMRTHVPVTERNHLTIAGTSFFAAQTSATIHPITLHPRNRLSRKIASKSRLLRARAMIDGRKYITNPKPKNGKKIKCARIMIALPLYSVALSWRRRIAVTLSKRPRHLNIKYAGHYTEVPESLPPHPPLPLQNRLQPGPGLLRQVIRLFIRRILARSHVRTKRLHGVR